jgi:8-oxo-dGTP pyrophosphatase MutT (NUDIX family)
MTVHDGNGWTRCGRGHRHWGRHGAAGLLLAATDQTGRHTVLLQQRSWWGSYGGAWGPPGGARDSHESVVRAALREAIEECAIDPRPVRVHGVLSDDHGGWTYQTVLANTAVPLAAAAVSEETSEVAWVPVAEVERLPLHPGFAGQWAALRTALTPLTIIVDAANVMGSRPDGWWRDRAGAARRLIDEISELAMDGVVSLPDSIGVPALERWFPRFVVVVEGAARTVAASTAAASTAAASTAAASTVAESQVLVVGARGSGDDEIVRQAAETAETAGPCLVVTADRELRGRCEAVGAAVTGPRWLLALL